MHKTSAYVSGFWGTQLAHAGTVCGVIQVQNRGLSKQWFAVVLASLCLSGQRPGWKTRGQCRLLCSPASGAACAMPFYGFVAVAPAGVALQTRAVRAQCLGYPLHASFPQLYCVDDFVQYRCVDYIHVH